MNNQDENPNQENENVTVAESDVAEKTQGEETEESAAPEDSNESEDAESTENSENSEEEDSEKSEEDEKKLEAKDQKSKRKSGYQRKIDKLTRALAEKDRETELWRKQVLGDKGSQDQVAATEAKPTGKPNPDDFETHEEYIEAVSDWKVEQKLQARDAEARKSQLKNEFDQKLKVHTDRVEKFAEAHDDFHEVIEDVDDVMVSPAMQELILGSDVGPDVMYELAKNREEFERINKLSPLAAAREFGKIEARLSKNTESQSKKEIKTTKATKPITPVGSRAASTTTKSLDDPNLSQREFEALRAKQIAERDAY